MWCRIIFQGWGRDARSMDGVVGRMWVMVTGGARVFVCWLCYSGRSKGVHSRAT
jgi:hypothetical protein